MFRIENNAIYLLFRTQCLVFCDFVFLPLSENLTNLKNFVRNISCEVNTFLLLISHVLRSFTDLNQKLRFQSVLSYLTILKIWKISGHKMMVEVNQQLSAIYFERKKKINKTNLSTKNLNTEYIFANLRCDIAVNVLQSKDE